MTASLLCLQACLHFTDAGLALLLDLVTWAGGCLCNLVVIGQCAYDSVV